MHLKDMVKKNQVMITALAIMIAVAGYLHFAGEVPLDSSLEASADVASQNQIVDQIQVEDLLADYDLASLEDLSDADLEEMVAVEPLENEVPGDAIYTASQGIATISEAKLLKEQTRARNKETLLEIIDNTELEDIQKSEAIQNMISMTNVAEMEMGAEILLEAKGFADCIVSISDTGVDVVVNASSLTDVELAQIVDIVKRKTGTNESQIVISTVNVD